MHDQITIFSLILICVYLYGYKVCETLIKIKIFPTNMQKKGLKLKLKDRTIAKSKIFFFKKLNRKYININSKIFPTIFKREKKVKDNMFLVPQNPWRRIKLKEETYEISFLALMVLKIHVVHDKFKIFIIWFKCELNWSVLYSRQSFSSLPSWQSCRPSQRLVWGTHFPSE